MAAYATHAHPIARHVLRVILAKSAIRVTTYSTVDARNAKVTRSAVLTATMISLPKKHAALAQPTAKIAILTTPVQPATTDIHSTPVLLSHSARQTHLPQP